MIAKYVVRPWPPESSGMTEAEVLQRVEGAGEQLLQALHQAELDSDRFARYEMGTREVSYAIDQCLARLSETGVWGPTNRLAAGKLWELAGDQLQHGALLNRARFKPRGYAGDHVMLRQICEDWRCDHPLGRLLDHYFQNHAAPKAVRNRTRIVAEAIVERVRAMNDIVSVTSVGSGPAIDLLWAAESLLPEERRRLRAEMLDLDPQALEESQQRLLPLLGRDKIVARRENLYRLPRLREAESIRSELIACTGFFDYLNDEDAAALLGYLWQQLAPSGRLLVFNFAPHNPSRALMEWMGLWYLVYRDEQAMRDLSAAAGIATECCEIKAEAEGVDLYIDATKPLSVTRGER